MRLVFWAVGAVLALMVTVVAIGLLLPGEHTSIGVRTVAGGPEQVWAVMTTVEDYPTWRDDVDRVEVIDRPQGSPMWVEHSSSGPVTYRVIESTPFHRWAVEIADEDLGFGGSWTWELVARSPGTAVTVTERGEVYGPVMRFVFHFFMDEEETIDRYLDALESRMTAGG